MVPVGGGGGDLAILVLCGIYRVKQEDFYIDFGQEPQQLFIHEDVLYPVFDSDRGEKEVGLHFFDSDWDKGGQEVLPYILTSHIDLPSSEKDELLKMGPVQSFMNMNIPWFLRGVSLSPFWDRSIRTKCMGS